MKKACRPKRRRYRPRLQVGGPTLNFIQREMSRARVFKEELANFRARQADFFYKKSEPLLTQ
jgi:hypothetical protein